MTNDWREEALLAQRKYRGEIQNGRLAKAQRVISERLDVVAQVEADDRGNIFVPLDDEYQLFVNRVESVYLNRRVYGRWRHDEQELYDATDLGAALTRLKSKSALVLYLESYSQSLWACTVLIVLMTIVLIIVARL